MNLSKPFLRSCMLYDFKSGLKVTESAHRINNAFGANTVSERTIREWFSRFRAGDYNLQDQPRSGRPSELNVDRLRQLVLADPQQTTRDIGETLGVSNSTVFEHLRAIGFVSKLSKWVPHQLTDVQRQRRCDAALTLLSFKPHQNWLSSIVTGDEKWILYVNVVRRRSWCAPGDTPQATAKPGLHPEKVMLSVWWDCKGIIMFELLPTNTTITAELYCNQLDRLAVQIRQKRPHHGPVRFLHDNARPHTAARTRQKLLDLGWEILVHPPYSPDLAPSDFHLFLSMSNALRNMSFANDDELNQWLVNFFASKPASFYGEGIMKLPEKWQMVLDSNGDYFN